MLILLLGACGAPAPGFDPSGERSDLDDAGGAVTGGADDTATGDTAGDTAGDTGEAVCTAADLELQMIVEDAAGTTGTSFTWPTEITTRAVFTNPCEGRLQFTTANSCLVDTWTLTDGTGADTPFSGNCVDGTTRWTLEAKEATSVTASWGTVDRSTYEVRADTVLGRPATAFFSVQ
jgi:hypothetical protein